MKLCLLFMIPLICLATTGIRAEETTAPAEKAEQVMGWDGKMIGIKPAATNITDVERKRIEDAFHKAVTADQTKYDKDARFDFPFKYTFRISPQGYLVFWPTSFDETARRIASDPKLLAPVRERCLALQAQLREQGIDAYSSSRWEFLYEKCGND